MIIDLTIPPIGANEHEPKWTAELQSKVPCLMAQTASLPELKACELRFSLNGKPMGGYALSYKRQKSFGQWIVRAVTVTIPDPNGATFYQIHGDLQFLGEAASVEHPFGKEPISTDFGFTLTDLTPACEYIEEKLDEIDAYATKRHNLGVDDAIAATHAAFEDAQQSLRNNLSKRSLWDRVTAYFR